MLLEAILSSVFERFVTVVLMEAFSVYEVRSVGLLNRRVIVLRSRLTKARPTLEIKEKI